MCASVCVLCRWGSRETAGTIALCSTAATVARKRVEGCAGTSRGDVDADRRGRGAGGTAGGEGETRASTAKESGSRGEEEGEPAPVGDYGLRGGARGGRGKGTRGTDARGKREGETYQGGRR